MLHGCVKNKNSVIFLEVAYLDSDDSNVIQQIEKYKSIFRYDIGNIPDSAFFMVDNDKILQSVCKHFDIQLVDTQDELNLIKKLKK